MTYFKGDTFVIHDYQKQKPFSSFLPVLRVIWESLYGLFMSIEVKLISSFGLRDKNGAILEFYPANCIHLYTNHWI